MKVNFETKQRPWLLRALLLGAVSVLPACAQADETAMFDSPVRVMAGDVPVQVEAPGYACPTMADVDGDGKDDLVVGQFAGGAMLFCKNVAEKDAQPKFAAAEYMKNGDERVVVPGVW